MKKPTSHRWILVVLAMIGGLLALSCSGVPGNGGSNTYTVEFSTTLGLYRGNNVAVLGFPVGKVTSVDEQGTHVKVTFTVEDGVKIPADAKAVILRPGIVTDRALELTPAYSGGPILEPGSTIPLTSTSQPLEYDEVLSALDDLLVALSPQDGRHVARDASQAAAQLLNGNGSRIRKAIDGLSAASQIGADAAPDLRALVKDLDVVVGAVAGHDRQIRRFASNLADVGDILAADSKNLPAALSTTVDTLKSVTAFVAANKEVITRNVTRAVGTSHTLANHLRELQEILVEFPLALQNIGRAIDPDKAGLKAKIAYGGTVNGSGIFQQVCQGSQIPFLCALTQLSGIPDNFTGGAP